MCPLMLFNLIPSKWNVNRYEDAYIEGNVTNQDAIVNALFMAGVAKSSKEKWIKRTSVECYALPE